MNIKKYGTKTARMLAYASRQWRKGFPRSVFRMGLDREITKMVDAETLNDLRKAAGGAA